MSCGHSTSTLKACIEFHHYEMFRLSIVIKRLREQAEATVCDPWPIIQEIDEKRHLINDHYRMIEYYTDIINDRDPEIDDELSACMSRVNLN